jgi:hypothetical protein
VSIIPVRSKNAVSVAPGIKHVTAENEPGMNPAMEPVIRMRPRPRVRMSRPIW